MADGRSTIGTFLFQGTSASSLTKLCRIKKYPDLGAAPDMIDITDLEDEDESKIPGVRKASDMAFTANYTPEDYKKVDDKANIDSFYEVRFGDEAGKDGIFAFQGSHSVFAVGGDVNGARDMTITIARRSSITFSTPTASQG